MANVFYSKGTTIRLTIEGGPQLKAALDRLALASSGPIAQDAVRAGLDVIRVRWAETAPVGSELAGDDFPGAYREEMSNPKVIRVGKTRVSAAGGVGKVRGTVGPRLRPSVPGIPSGDQPAVYAAVLEFGGYVGRGHRTFIAPHGTVRAAVDATATQAADALAAKLRQAMVP